MLRKLGIVAVAPISLSLPQIALANSSSHNHSLASLRALRAEFSHWWSLGNAGPKPMRNIDGEKIPGAPSGMLAGMLEIHPLSTQAVLTVSVSHS